jgi:hypothetical protein
MPPGKNAKISADFKKKIKNGLHKEQIKQVETCEASLGDNTQ